MPNSTHFCDVLVVGAGPAGIAAAWCAARAFGRVTLIDDNPQPGGQIWRSEESNPYSPDARYWLNRVAACNVELIRRARVFAHPAAGVLLAETFDGLRELRYTKLVLALGARERFLPFPGWTLPNVTGAGGLQALVKSGLSIAGKRVVVSGSGPLLLAVAAFLIAAGADVRTIAEQAAWSTLLRFGVTLAWQKGKVTQALVLKKQIKRVPYRIGCWPVAACGDGRLEAVRLQHGPRTLEIECDYLACGFHLVPNVELAALLGCELLDGRVRVNEYQATSVADVYCAGETTGIGGLDLSLAEGRIAGYAVAGMQDESRKIFTERKKHQRFADRLNRTFALRSELRALPEDGTIVCRCEDVSYGSMRACGSWREAKLKMRSGMGPCQGRVCGAAAEFLFGWGADSIRPPVFPASLDAIGYHNEG